MNSVTHDPLGDCDAPPLRKSFQVTLDDAAQTQVILQTQRAGARAHWKNGLFGWGMFTVFAYVVQRLIPENNDYPVIVAAVTAVPLGFLYYAFVRWMPVPLFRLTLRKLYGSGPFSVTVELGETQLVHTSDDFEQRFRWPAISRLAATPEELRVFVAKFGLVRIPLSVFSSEDEKRQWMEALERKTGLSFS